MKTYKAVRKPIYIITVTASAKDFLFATEVFKNFVSKYVEYSNCQYDKEFSIVDNTWTLKLYRECAVDFVEE